MQNPLIKSKQSSLKIKHLQYKNNNKRNLPSWFRQNIPNLDKMQSMRCLLKDLSLNTVCQGARCPNIGYCWGKGVATFMILGAVCTRACRFCAVNTGAPSEVDINEPENIADAIKKLALKYVVITSVTRDDLEDQGVGQFIKTINAIRNTSPNTKIEVLIPDFQNKIELLNSLLKSQPDVISHNIETVERVFDVARPQANFDRSLSVFRNINTYCKEKGIILKSGFMLGLGETKKEVIDLIAQLRNVGCDILTIGQYLAPKESSRHLPIKEFISPEQFDWYKNKAQDLGIKYVASGPLVRSSFLAEEGYFYLKDRRYKHNPISIKIVA